MFKFNKKTFFLGLAIAALLSYFLLSQVHISEVKKSLTSFPLWAIVIAFLIQITLNLLKSTRFHILLNKQVRIRDLVPIIFLHNFFIIFMPSRTGELAFPYFLKEKYDISLGQSLSSLVVARVLDVLVILSLLLGTVVIGFREQVSGIKGFLPLSITGFVGLLVIFWAILKHSLWIKEKLGKAFTKLGFYERKFLGSISRKIEEVFIALAEVGGARKIFPIALLTVLIWPLTFAFEFELFRSLGIAVTYWQFLVISFFPVLIHIIPVQGLAGVGTYEATFAGGFVLFGFALEQMIPLVFSVHIVLLATTAVLGLVGFMIYRWTKPRPARFSP